MPTSDATAAAPDALPLRLPAPPPPLRWAGWGAEGHGPAPPSPALRALLVDALGLDGGSHPGVPEEAVEVPAPSLTAAARAALAAAVGDAGVDLDPRARLVHATGRSTIDLLRLRSGTAPAVPDAVVVPGDHDRVLAVLAACARHGVAVVPYGGGTSVVGGLDALRGSHAAVVSLDLRRLDRLLEVDSVSSTALLEAGLRAPDAEALLGGLGLTLGHLPQSYEHASLGGFAATRSAGQASSGYGRFADLVEEIVLATPVGTLVAGRAPASAAGPDLRQLVLGSEGAFGVVTRLRCRVRPRPDRVVDEGWRLPDWETGLAAVRALAQGDGLLPAVARLSDEMETAVGLATGPGGPAQSGCLLITAFEGSADAVERRRRAAGAALTAAGAAPLGAEPGTAWRAGRFAAPFLRDAVLDLGGLVETLETAAPWSLLPALHRAVRAALASALDAAGTPPVVLAHVSHVDPTGASLYVTVACRQAADPVRQWSDAKAAATEAILDAGGTLTHHHAVGTVHRRWMEREVGPLGVAVLRAVKAALDPTGIMNPGKLVP